MYGSEDLVKNVLEYVVFEKHLSNPYGIWRLHAKIVPEWAPPREVILKTFKKPLIESPSAAFIEKEKEKQRIKEDEEIDKENFDPREEKPAAPQQATA
jgi:large subunit ribosomal protein L45